MTTPVPARLAIAADGSYAARLVTVRNDEGGEGWCPERWTLTGPEPYAVRLPAGQPEEADSPVLPLADGRVLIGRHAADRYHFELLYPSSPATGQVPLGAVDAGAGRLALLPPAPDGTRAYAMVRQGGAADRADRADRGDTGDGKDGKDGKGDAKAAPDEGGDEATALWLVCGGAFGPELVTVLPGRCSGGAWLDGDGRLLALDRTDAAGRTRAIAVDVLHGGEPTELLRIAEDSNDRLVLADPDSGLLLVRSDAPGEERLGWGVLGSHRPVRFPEALHVPGAAVTPFAVQPGQVLLPESCGVALRMTTAEADWVAVWRPEQREVQHLAAPPGWLAGTGLWTAAGELLLPYETPAVPCGLSRTAVPVPGPQPPPSPSGSAGSPSRAGDAGAGAGPVSENSGRNGSGNSGRNGGGAPKPSGVTKPVPLQQAPL